MELAKTFSPPGHVTCPGLPSYLVEVGPRNISRPLVVPPFHVVCASEHLRLQPQADQFGSELQKSKISSSVADILLILIINSNQDHQ